MRTIRSLMVAVGLILLTVPSFAQTTLSSTTLAAAVTSTASQINVASASGIEVNDRVAILGGGQRVAEFVRVLAINGTFLTVSRAVDSRSLAHASGATVYHGPEAQYYTSDPTPGATCTQASELYLPHINKASRLITQCSPASVWYRLDQTFTISCRALLIADMVDQSCWNVDASYVLVGIKEVHKTKEAGGTLTLIARRQQTTEAPASGDALNTALDMAAAATDETVRSATLTTTGSFLLLSAGERLGLDFTDDTAGELAGVTVTFVLAPR